MIGVSEASDVGTVDWGWLGSPAPNIKRGPATVSRGISFDVFGDFNAAQGPRSAVLYDPRTPDVLGYRREFDAIMAAWGVAALNLTLASGTPSGAYQLRVYEDASRRTYGTWIPITVR